MAFDRCVAIREPLRYATILTAKCIGAIGLASVPRRAALHLPLLCSLEGCGSHLRMLCHIPTVFTLVF